MSVMPPLSSSLSGTCESYGQAPANSLDQRWLALLDAANALAAIAMAECDNSTSAIRDFPTRLRGRSEFERLTAERKIDELTAIMQPGLNAVLEVCARGRRPYAAAHVLLREFCAARDSILALAPEQQAAA